MSIESLEKEIEELRQQINPLVSLKRLRESQLRKLRSEEFIRVNKITRDDVECSTKPNIPYFGDIYKFGCWLHGNTNKKWCEWNGSLYLTREIINGKMEYNPIGRYADIPKKY